MVVSSIGSSANLTSCVSVPTGELTSRSRILIATSILLPVYYIDKSGKCNTHLSSQFLHPDFLSGLLFPICDWTRCLASSHPARRSPVVIISMTLFR